MIKRALNSQINILSLGFFASGNVQEKTIKGVVFVEDEEKGVRLEI